MALQTYLTSDVMEAHYDTNNEWLYWDWKGVQDTGEVQAACRQLLAFIRQSQARKILNDHTHVTQVNRDLDGWVVQEYLPELGRAGIEDIAWVCCPVLELRNRTEVAFAGNVYRPRVAVFDDIDAACTWLTHAPSLATLPQYLPTELG